MMKILNIYMALLIAILLLLSCRTVKHIDRVEYKSDSTAVHERDSVIRLYKLDSAGWTSLIAMLSENQVVFNDTGSTRIEYYPDGSLKTVEGKLKSVTARLSKEEKGAAYWRTLYDSAASHASKDSTTVKTEYVTEVKEVRREFIPWWVWLITIPAILIGYYIKSKFK